MPTPAKSRRARPKKGTTPKSRHWPVPEDTESSKPKYFSRAVAKALEVIEILKQESRPVSLHSLSKAVDLSKASLLRILETLEDGGYLTRTPSGDYTQNAGITVLLPVGWLQRLLDVAQAEMRELTLRVKENSALAHLLSNHIEVIAVCESQQLVRMGNTTGRILPPHASSLGKAITAFQDDARRQGLVYSYGMPAFTRYSITDERKLEDEFARIREQGYALDAKETTEEGTCFGAPIRTPRGSVVAALSVSVPITRLQSADDHDFYIRSVMESAGRITESLSRET